MEDTDLYPCPWCRGELVQSEHLIDDNAPVNNEYAVVCASCFMRGPTGVTLSVAREVYNVLAKYVDDTIRAMYWQRGERSTSMLSAAQAFLGARNEHPPY